MSWIVTAALVLPAFFLFARQSTYLVDYLVWLTALNRGIRRFFDWLEGAFNPFSPVSLTPLVVSVLLCIHLGLNFRRLPPKAQTVLRWLLAGFGFAFAVGFLRNGLAAIYGAAEYLGPISLLGFAALLKGRPEIFDRWIKTIGWAAVVVSIYGVIQYYTIPPWDALWLIQSKMVTLGVPEPTKMTVFSTMQERGPLASFLAFAVVPMIVSKRWRNAGGWFSVLIIIAVLLLTFARTGLIFVVLVALLFPVLNHGKNVVQISLLVCLAAVGLNFWVKRVEGGERIQKRLSTLQNISDDGSFKGRIEIAKYGIGRALTTPFGTGLGSTGLAGKINTGTQEAGAVIGDNGYLSIFLSWGWFGAGCFFYSLILIWRHIRKLERFGLRDEGLMMCKAIFAGTAVVLYAGNWLAGTGAMIFWLFAGYAMMPSSLRELLIRTFEASPDAQGSLASSGDLPVIRSS